MLRLFFVTPSCTSIIKDFRRPVNRQIKKAGRCQLLKKRTAASIDAAAAFSSRG
jgi:hypothetical protein